MADRRHRRRRNAIYNVDGRPERRVLDFSNPLEFYGDDESVRRHFRLYPAAILFVCGLVAPAVSREFTYGLPVLVQVCATLKFLGSGQFFINVGAHNSLNLSTSSAWRATEAVVTVLASRLQEFVHFPCGNRVAEVQLGFLNKGVINGRAGAPRKKMLMPFACEKQS